MPQLKAGDKAPAFSLQDQSGTTVSLAQFKGQRVTLHFETYNNGWGGTAAMYVDDVSFMACR